jgi:TonB family protein
MSKRIPAILTLLGAVLAFGGLAVAGEIVDPDADGVSAPYLIAESRVTPSYPPAAYAAKYEGVVSLKAIVNADGSVGAVQVLDSTRKSMGFESAAIEAVSQWRFEPARKDDTVVDSYSLIRLRFNPPSRASRGSVATAFEGSATPSMSPAAPMTSKAGMMTASATPDAARTTWLPVEYKRYRKYGRASGRIGEVYDRRLLIPPGTGSGQLQSK